MTALTHSLSPSPSTFEDIQTTLVGTPWTVSEESVGGISTAILVRRSERLLSRQRFTKIDSKKNFTVKTDPSFACNTNGNAFRPSSPMGAEEWPGRTGGSDRAIAPGLDPVGGGSHEVVFGDLPTVKAMGTGKCAPVIGFDTEFTHREDGGGVIDSYQFSLIDPSDSDYRFDIVLLPLVKGERLPFESALCVVIRSRGCGALRACPMLAALIVVISGSLDTTTVRTWTLCISSVVSRWCSLGIISTLI